MREFRPGDILTARDLNDIGEALGPLARARLAGGYTSGGALASALPERDWLLVKVTAGPAGTPPAHDWQEVVEDLNNPGSFVTKPEGVSGTAAGKLPLYDLNGGTLAAGTVVRAWRGLGDYYLCSQQPLCVVKVTSGTPTGGLYPGDVEAFSVGGGTWSGSGSVWVVGLNGETLTSGTRYEGCEAGVNPSDGKPVFAVTVPGAGGGGTTITTKDKNGTTIDSACSIIKMDAAGVLTLSASAGTDTFTVTAAGASQAGVVSTTTQTFAGNKTFTGTVAVGSSSTPTGITAYGVGGVALSMPAFTAGGVTYGGASGWQLVISNGNSCGLSQIGGGSNVNISYNSLNGDSTLTLVAGNLAHYAIDDTNGSTTGVSGTTAEGDTVYGGLTVGIGVSDARLKFVTGRVENALGVVRAVTPATFRWDEEACNTAGAIYAPGDHVGFLAQDLRASLPSLARDRGDGYLTPNLPAVVAVLWQAVRELADVRVRAAGG